MSSRNRGSFAWHTLANATSFCIRSLGPHAAIVASGSPAAYEQALAYLRPAGTLVLVGLPGDCKVKVDVFQTVFTALRLVGS